METKEPGQTKSDSPYASPQADALQRGTSTFSLASLLAFIVLCAVGFGITYYTVGLGVAYFIIAILFFVRVKLHHRTAWVHGFEGTALAVTLVVLLTPICCGVAFFTNCLAGVVAADQLRFINSPDPVIALAFGLGGVTAFQVAEVVFAFCLRKKSHETS